MEEDTQERPKTAETLWGCRMNALAFAKGVAVFVAGIIVTDIVGAVVEANDLAADWVSVWVIVPAGIAGSLFLGYWFYRRADGGSDGGADGDHSQDT